MIARWRRTSIRARLAALYAATLLAVLLAHATGVWLLVADRLEADLDQRLREDFEVVESMLATTEDGRPRWGSDHQHGPDELEDLIRAEVWSAGGALLLRTVSVEPWADRLPPVRGSEVRLDGLTAGAERLRLLQGPYTVGGRPVIIRVIRTEERMRSFLRTLGLIDLLGLPLVAALAGTAGYLMARRALRPVALMTERAKAIAADRLHERLPVDNPHDELGQLALVFNDTFARLERSFAQLRRFTADASHELRTPLTSIRSVGEVALRRPRADADYREAIGSMLEDVERLARLLDHLLTLNRADAGRVAVQSEPTDLGHLVREVASELAVLAEEKDQHLFVQDDGTVTAVVDPTVLRLAVVNLIDNAIKHGHHGGRIRVATRRSAGGVVVEVADDGPGIPPAHRDRIFERFYRVDKARSRALGGSGLGLSIAAWAVAAHGGRIDLDGGQDQGAVFRIHLPAETGGPSS